MLTDIRTDRRDDAQGRFSQFRETAKQGTNIYMNRMPKRLQNEIPKYGAR